MNYGPLVFLGIFATMITSWFGMIFVPQLQLGRLQPVAAEVSGGLYPAAKAGIAQQGAEVYRQQGCYYCHSQQIRQSTVSFDVVLLKAGENTNDLAAVVSKYNTEWGQAGLRKLIQNTPQVVLSGASLQLTEKFMNDIGNVTASADDQKPQAMVKIIPSGPDFERGWGVRRSVAADYLFDHVPMLGEQRIGPDLTNIGARPYNTDWHLAHLYNPSKLVQDSKMPSYKFLFETRRVGRNPAPDALKLAEGTVEQGYEVVPKQEAKALAAYLLGLKTTTPLFEAPMPAEIKKPEAATTNAVTTAAPAK
jgi:cbb3-type cytochrome oxidase cytochrome c subunit